MHVDVDPASWPPEVTLAETRAVVSAAIHAKQLRRTSEALLDGPAMPPDAEALVRQALETCRSIRRTNEAHQSRLLNRFEDAGIEGAAVPAGRVPDQYHACSLAVGAGQLAAALDVAAGDRYLVSPALMRVAANDQLAWTRSNLMLTRDDEYASRLILKWRDPWRIRLLRRVFEPSPADYGVAQWPRSLWPLVFLNKPLRLAGGLLPRAVASNDPGPYLSTPGDLILPLLEAAGVSRDDCLVDLGCGDGRVLIAAAERYGCRAKGVERDPVLADIARKKVRHAGVQDSVDIVEGDSASTSLEGATVVFMFLPAKMARALVPPTLGQLASGSRLLVHEQERLFFSTPPEVSMPIFGPASLTVAHLWQRP